MTPFIQGGVRLGQFINIPVHIGDDFPYEQWLDFSAYIKVSEDGTVQQFGAKAEFLNNEK